MKQLNKLKKILKENPGCCIYYYDKDQFGVFKSKRDLQLVANGKKDWYDTVLLDCSDYYDGYVPLLAKAMADILNIKINGA